MATLQSSILGFDQAEPVSRLTLLKGAPPYSVSDHFASAFSYHWPRQRARRSQCDPRLQQSWHVH